MAGLDILAYSESSGRYDHLTAGYAYTSLDVMRDEIINANQLAWLMSHPTHNDMYVAIEAHIPSGCTAPAIVSNNHAYLIVGDEVVVLKLVMSHWCVQKDRTRTIKRTMPVLRKWFLELIRTKTEELFQK